MTVLEGTISMLKNFSDNDLLKVQKLISIFLKEEQQENPFRALSKEEILRELTYSRSLADEGLVWDAGRVCEDVESKYGI